jgi:hypothetical protein
MLSIEWKTTVTNAATRCPGTAMTLPDGDQLVEVMTETGIAQ